MKRLKVVACATALWAGAIACAGDEPGEPASPTSDDEATDTSAEVSSTAAISTRPASSESASAERSFSISIAEPAGLDPGLSQEIEGLQAIRLLFEPLVSLDPDLQVVPGVAQSWSVSDDGATWTFELDPEASFSDGRSVVADDFAFAFARAADPDFASPSAYQGLPIRGWAEVNGGEPSGAIGDVPVAGVVAVDDHTLTIETEEPFALLPKVLTYSMFAPIAPEYVDTEADAAAFAEQPIGNGAYMMDGHWEHNVGFDLVLNPYFHGTAGRADRIEFQIFGDMATAFREWQAGNLDIARITAPETIEAAQERYADSVVATPSATLTYVGLPTRRPPYDNPDLRMALSLAIDREAIATRVLRGTAASATGVVPPQALGALSDACEGCAYDPDRAVELYEQAGGIPDGKMVVYDIADDGTQGLETILNSWRDLFGLEIEVRSFEFAQYLEETATADQIEGPFELGWVWDYPSGYSMLSPLFESTSGVNNLGWSNPEFDAELAKVRTAPDEEAGLPFLANAQRIVERELPLLPITFLNDVGVHSDRVSNVHVDAGAAWRLELIDVAPD
jgi:ABC-type transport system substrate-binding protein